MQTLLLGYDLGTMPTFNDCFFNDCFYHYRGHYGLATVRLLPPLLQALRPSYSTTASTTTAGIAGTTRALLPGYNFGTMPTSIYCSCGS